MNTNLKNILESIVEQNGNNDLMAETTAAAKLLLDGGYEGHSEDILFLEECNIGNGFDLEKVLSQGDWFFQ